MSDYFSSQYSGMNGINPEDHQSILDFYSRCNAYYNLELKPYLPLLSQQEKVLDVGCGIGGALYYMHQLGYQHLTGVDSSEAQLSIAGKYVSAEFIKNDAVSYLENKGHHYSLILCFDLIEHLPKDEVLRFLSATRQRLKEEGTIIIRTPNMGLPVSPFFRYNDFTHCSGFTGQSLYSVLYEAGFRTIEIRNSYIGSKRKFVLELIQKTLSRLYNTPLGNWVTPNLVAVAQS